MNKIPIKYAIESRAWFRCETNLLHSSGGEPFNFKLRALSFSKINLDEVYEPEGQPWQVQLDQGDLYILKIEVVNLNKDAVRGWDIEGRIILVDQDDFAFDTVRDMDFTYNSNIAKSTGLNRFSSVGNVRPLQPKIRVSGALAFLLPDDEKAEYFLSVGSGNIQEV